MKCPNCGKKQTTFLFSVVLSDDGKEWDKWGCDNHKNEPVRFYTRTEIFYRYIDSDEKIKC